MIELRPYQIEVIPKLRKAIGLHKRVILQSATGSGKSVIFSELVRLSVLRGSRVLVLTHRSEIFRSTLRHLSNVSIKCVEINRDAKVIEEGHVYLGMVETVSRRLNKGLVLDIDLIIVDECHFENFSKVIEKFPDVYVLGVSATPSGKHIAKIYKEIISTISINDLIRQGYLSPCKAFEMQDDLSDLKAQGGEFTDASLWDHYKKPKLYQGVVENWKKYAYGKRTVIYNVNIEHCEAMKDEFLAAGIHSEILVGTTPDDKRIDMLKRLESGELLVIQSVGVLTTGTDIITLECAVLNRATNSLPLFLQMCGRAARPHLLKPYFTVLDFGCNHTRHGMWNEDRIWSLHKEKKKRKGVAPVRICEKCRAVLPLQAKVCEYCGAIKKEKKGKLKAGQMMAVEANAVPESIKGKLITECSMEELHLLVKMKRYKLPFILRVLRSKGDDAIREYGKIAGYKSGWAWSVIGRGGDSKFTNVVVR